MNVEWLVTISIVLAAIPAVMFLANLWFYRPVRRELAVPAPTGALSVLIPARNEEHNIRATLEAALASRGCEFEVVVLDDHSTDATAHIVREIASRDPRLRLEHGPALPPGWCGKQHACHVLAGLARNPLLAFIDADVRLAPDALARLTAHMESRPDIALSSGVPRQELGTFSERLLLPLIHFVLLGYLPMAFMRWTKLAGFSAGCGQLFIARADAYRATGGHANIRTTLHDGVKLPRLFRRAGFQTDLFDATDLASCRMYHTNAETWRGLGKNATEGLGAPGAILPMTALLLGGQVMPFVLIASAPWLPAGTLQPAIAAAMLALLPRLIAVARFRQPVLSALLHPIGVLALLIIQWRALAAGMLGRPSEWKGRAYPGAASAKRTLTAAVHSVPLLALIIIGSSAIAVHGAPAGPSGAALTNSPHTSFSLRDQFDTLHQVPFPRSNLLVLTIADRKGNDQIDGWLAVLTNRVSDRVSLEGIADVSAVPGWLRGTVKAKFREARPHPVMLDWSGDIVRAYPMIKNQANIFLIERDGRVMLHTSGPASRESVSNLVNELERRQQTPPPQPRPTN